MTIGGGARYASGRSTVASRPPKECETGSHESRRHSHQQRATRRNGGGYQGQQRQAQAERQRRAPERQVRQAYPGEQQNAQPHDQAVKDASGATGDVFEHTGSVAKNGQ